MKLAPDALEYLQQHSWPGNDQELQNVIEGAVVRGAGAIIEAQHLRLPKVIERTRSAVEDWERRLILDALQKARGNKRQAAEDLGLSFGVFNRRLRQHGIGDG